MIEHSARKRAHLTIQEVSSFKTQCTVYYSDNCNSDDCYDSDDEYSDDDNDYCRASL